MNEIAIAKKIIFFLTNEELSKFCDMYDDGSLDDVMIMFLEKDKENFPEKYNNN